MTHFDKISLGILRKALIICVTSIVEKNVIIKHKINFKKKLIKGTEYFFFQFPDFDTFPASFLIVNAYFYDRKMKQHFSFFCKDSGFSRKKKGIFFFFFFL